MNTSYLAIKFILNFVSYCGLFLGIDQQFLDNKIIDKLQLSAFEADLILYVAVIFWIIKGGWFAYDKFFLERTERLFEIDKKKKELDK